VLSREASAVPGQWKTERVEPARGPMLAATDPEVQMVTVQCSTQTLKTEFINNIVGYLIDQDPCPMIVMQPNEKLAQAWSKDRLDKMIRDTPCLKGKVAEKNQKTTSNTILHKEFAGGHVSIIGSNAAGDLSMRPVRAVLCDEVDKYPESAQEEGDPVKLVSERTATFWNRLIVLVCSPTIEGKSRINQSYLESDQRVFKYPCPECQTVFEPQWKHVKWPKDEPENAAIECPHCFHKFTEAQRIKAIRKGSYFATAPFYGHAGFKVNKLSSPWEPIPSLVKKFLEAKGSQESLKVFINTQLAETWQEEGEVPEWDRLYRQRENYKIGTVPEGVYFLTAGVDVQKDRLEYEICGWGERKQSWSIEYGVIHGDTSNEQTWEKLDEVVGQTWPHANGYEMPLRLMAVDSGFNTQMVYTWCRKWPMDRVIAVKGTESLPVIFTQPSFVDLNQKGRKIRKGFKVWTLGVNVIKSELYGWLRQEPPLEEGEPYPFGYCHFPEYSQDYFKSLTAEQLVAKKVKGFTKYEWQKIRERNEALDARCYNRAAASIVGIDRFRDADWQKMKSQIAKLNPVKSNEKEEKKVKKESKKKKKRKKSFWD